LRLAATVTLTLVSRDATGTKLLRELRQQNLECKLVGQADRGTSGQRSWVMTAERGLISRGKGWFVAVTSYVATSKASVV
jgi:hypothetical protein